MRASVYWIGCVFSVMSLSLSWAGQQEAVDWLSQQAQITERVSHRLRGVHGLPCP